MVVLRRIKEELFTSKMTFRSKRTRFSAADNAEIFRCVQKEWSDMMYHYFGPDRDERLTQLRRIMDMVSTQEPKDTGEVNVVAEAESA